MKKIAITIALLSATGAAGADETATAPAPQIVCAAPAPGRSVQYFVAHPNEITPALKKCSQRADAPDCEQADEAEQRLQLVADRKARQEARERTSEAFKRSIGN